MNNNDVLRRLRYTFDFDDDTMIKIFGLAEYTATRADVSDWLKKDDNPEQKSLHDKYLAIFLNGFINLKRGKREGPQPKPEKTLNNNLILRKLKIALNLKDHDILDILDMANFQYKISKRKIIQARILLGIQQQIIYGDASLFPNPTSGNLEIQWNVSDFEEEEVSFEIFSVQGKAIQSISQNKTSNNSVQLNVQDLNNGVYFVKIKLGANEVIVKQFVKM